MNLLSQRPTYMSWKILKNILLEHSSARTHTSHTQIGFLSPVYDHKQYLPMDRCCFWFMSSWYLFIIQCPNSPFLVTSQSFCSPLSILKAINYSPSLITWDGITPDHMLQSRSFRFWNTTWFHHIHTAYYSAWPWFSKILTYILKVEACAYVPY